MQKLSHVQHFCCGCAHTHSIEAVACFKESSELVRTSGSSWLARQRGGAGVKESLELVFQALVGLLGEGEGQKGKEDVRQHNATYHPEILHGHGNTHIIHWTHHSHSQVTTHRQLRQADPLFGVAHGPCGVRWML